MAFTGYYPYTYDHTKVATSDKTDFTVLVDLTDNRLKQTGGGGEVTNVNGYDVGFYSDTGLTTKLKWDVKLYDGTAGQIVAFVKIATLSHTVDGVVYIAIGDAGITTFQGDAPNTYDSHTKGVFHLGNGSSLSVVDSVALNTATNNGATATSGQIDGAAAFSGSSQYIDGGNATPIATNNLTVMCIAKPSVLTRGDLVTRWGAVDTQSQFDLLYGLASGKPNFFVSKGAGAPNASGVGSTAMSTGTSYLIHGVATGTSISVYLDGVVQSTNTVSYTIPTSSIVNYRFGDNTSADGPYTGSLSEVWIQDYPRDADWIADQYNFLMTPASCWTLGSWVGGGGGGGGKPSNYYSSQFGA